MSFTGTRVSDFIKVAQLQIVRLRHVLMIDSDLLLRSDFFCVLTEVNMDLIAPTTLSHPDVQWQGLFCSILSSQMKWPSRLRSHRKISDAYSDLGPRAKVTWIGFEKNRICCSDCRIWERRPMRELLLFGWRGRSREEMQSFSDPMLISNSGFFLNHLNRSWQQSLPSSTLDGVRTLFVTISGKFSFDSWVTVVFYRSVLNTRVRSSPAAESPATPWQDRHLLKRAVGVCESDVAAEDAAPSVLVPACWWKVVDVVLLLQHRNCFLHPFFCPCCCLSTATCK